MLILLQARNAERFQGKYEIYQNVNDLIKSKFNEQREIGTAKVLSSIGSVVSELQFGQTQFHVQDPDKDYYQQKFAQASLLE